MFLISIFLFFFSVSLAQDLNLNEINKKIKNENIQKIDQGKVADEIYKKKGKKLKEITDEMLKKASEAARVMEEKEGEAVLKVKEESERELGEKGKRVIEQFRKNKVQQERIKKFSRDLYEKVGPSKSVNYKEEDFSRFSSGIGKGEDLTLDKQKDYLAPDERIYIFMSSSVPENVWKSYAEDLKQIGSRRIIVVLRGCIGGCERIKPTIEFLRRVAFNNGNDTKGFEIQIDPFLFRKYHISQVPAIVYAKGVYPKVPGMQEGIE
jgi:type-F conjugative transfer system pilin assembly protein TrbC